MVEYVVQSRDAVRVVVADEGVPVGYVCTVIECGNGGFAVAGCEHAGWNQHEQRHGEGHHEGVSFHWLPLQCEIRRLSPIVNSTAESRRHSAAVRSDLSTTLNTLQSPGLNCRLRKVIRYSRKRAFPERDLLIFPICLKVFRKPPDVST